MLIVDSQVHIWGANTPERPWPPNRGKPQRPVAFGADDLLKEMQAAGVDRVVLVPPKWEGDRNDLAIAAALAHPDRFASMGRLDPDLAESRGKLSTWRQQPGMMGLRFSFTAPEMVPLLTNGSMDWVWAEAEQAGVPMYVLVTHNTAHLIDAVAVRYPKLKLVLDHLAIPTAATDEAAFRDLDKVLVMAKRPNVAVKVSSLPGNSTEAYPYRNIHPHLRRVYDAYGPRRMFWGSDLTRLRGTYRECVTMFTEELPWLPAADLEWIMGRGVCEWIGWKI